MQAVPIHRGDKVDFAFFQPQFKLEGALQPSGQFQCHLITLKIEARQLASHPLVELFIGKFVAQEVIDVLIVLDLLFLDFDFFLSNLDLDLSASDLVADLLGIMSR